MRSDGFRGDDEVGFVFARRVVEDYDEFAIAWDERGWLVRVGREAAGDCVLAGLTEGLDCVGDAVELGGVHLVGGRHDDCGLVVESLCARSAWDVKCWRGRELG